MHKPSIILLGLLLLVVLGYFCIYTQWPNIQNDIDTRTHAELASQGLEQVGIDTNGRDIVLTGEVASVEIRQKAEEYAKNVYGVRIVDNQLSIATTPEPVVESEPTSKPESASIEQVIQSPKVEPLPEDTCQQEFDALLSSNEIQFTTNSAEIDTSSNALLRQLIDVANQCPESNIEISGHTDSRGSDDYNLRLSQARASSVMNYLISNGIEANRLSAAGYGETKPIADNKSEEGMAKNRRIEFNVEGP